ncbi:MFS transporter [Lentibacillus saliphilus]|uniref:MFS transporter n=1 Tax=Lentibacillus saliphilus TaxID=2737028 RepID=UPI001C30D790|nr:MFS transporter [Lentibacillus saliphilus]
MSPNLSPTWKDPSVLLVSVGIAGVGDFIYLVTINILVFQMTGSAAAVAALWVIGPLVNVLTKFWTGSFIDYRSKRNIMMTTYLARGTLIFVIPFLPHITFVYGILILLSTAKAFFIPSSMTYMTQLVPRHIRKRYNSIQSLTTSGAFIIGPSIAGTLIMLTDLTMTLIITAFAFFIAALLLYFLPKKEVLDKQAIPTLSIKQIKQDWSIVLTLLHDLKYVTLVYVAYLGTTIFSFTMDAQEVVFTQRVIGLSEIDYSLLISITGIGSIVGAFLLAVFFQKTSLRSLIAVGILMQTTGYLIYAFSWSFWSIAVGFTILGFFNAFLNAGITTFYQNNIPVKLMGRVTSILQLLQSLLQIIFVLAVGALADIIPLRSTIIGLASSMLIVALLIVFNVFRPTKKGYFLESE